MLKRTIYLLPILIFSLCIFSDKQAFADAHPDINLRDGNATWTSGGYRPSPNTSGAKTHARDVDPAVKSAWERKTIPKGAKYPRSLYNPNLGNRLVYDVYNGSAGQANKAKWSLETSGGEDFFVFTGWAVNNGYYHHDRHNTATYIGVINESTKERKIYKAQLTELNAGKDLEYNKKSNTGPINNKCPNTGSGAFQKYNYECNMEYKWVGFRAYIPLNDLFKVGNEEWQFYLIKAVKGYGRDTKLVYTELILPYSHSGIKWNGGELSFSSGEDHSTMIMSTSDVIRRTEPRGVGSGATLGYFTEHQSYRWAKSDESTGVVVWHGVYSPHDSNAIRWAASAYWHFGGQIATLTWKRTKADITIQHIDAKTQNILLQEKVTVDMNKKYTVNPKAKGTFKNELGYSYVASPKNQSFSEVINGNRTIKFYYKVSLPDPTRIVEQDGGKNTHGHSEGFVYWDLRKPNENQNSEFYVENNHVPAGTHYAIRNIKHTLNIGPYGNRYFEQKDPIIKKFDPTAVKDQDIEYNFEYEYTNHYEMSYTCTDKQDNECFEWKFKEYKPAWDEPYLQKFKLSDTKGTFTHYTVSRLGRITNDKAVIYDDIDKKTGAKQVSADLLDRTFYIKEKAVKGNEAYYLISTSPSRTTNTIAWVNELDMMTYTHFGMNSTAKTLTLKGEGAFYSIAWGAKKQEVTPKPKKGDKFVVNLTETVGDNVWYRGKLNGSGSDIWIEGKYTNSTEVPVIKPSKIEVIKQGTGENLLKLENKHKANEEFKLDYTEHALELEVGRLAMTNLTEPHFKEETYNERFSFDTSNTFLISQTWKPIDEKIEYDSDLGNVFPIVPEQLYYFPYDLDQSIRDKYQNTTSFLYSDYAIPLRIGTKNDNSIIFNTKDNFFITKNEGFLFSVPASITDKTEIEKKAKEAYEAFTGKEYADTVLSDVSDGSRYYLNIDGNGVQKPDQWYSDDYVIGKIGLSDITVHLNERLKFDKYLIGSPTDKTLIAEEFDSVKHDEGISYTNSIVIKAEQQHEIKELAKERSKLLHSFRSTDAKEKYDQLKTILPSLSK